MKFSDWLMGQAKVDDEVKVYLKNAIHNDTWPYQVNNLKSIISQLNTKGVNIEILGNLLKFWTKYLKEVSSVRPINANEIRDVREVLVNMLKWIRINTVSNLNNRDDKALQEAELQVAYLEEKEVELRYYSITNNK